MNPYRVVIVDDEPEARNGLSHSLKGDHELEILDSCANGLEAIQVINEFQVDLVLLDIQMPEIDGFEVLKNVKSDKLPLVIFVTAYDQYAIKAFEYHALDYLLKPYTEERLFQAISFAKKRLQSDQRPDREPLEKLVNEMSSLRAPGPDAVIWAESEASRPTERVAVRSNGAIHFFNRSDIEYFEAYDAYVKIHLNNNNNGQMMLIKNSMKALEALFGSASFLRIHRSYIVNTNFLDKVTSGFSGDFTAHLTNGTLLKGSRNYRANLEAFLLKN